MPYAADKQSSLSIWDKSRLLKGMAFLWDIFLGIIKANDDKTYKIKLINGNIFQAEKDDFHAEI